MAHKNNTVHFEASLKQINEIVSQMETGDLSLEESLKAFEQGLKLTRTCQKALEKAEQKVEVLIEKNSDLLLEPFDDDADDDEFYPDEDDEDE